MKVAKRKKERDVYKKQFYYKSKHIELKGSANDKDLKNMAKKDQKHSIILRYILPATSLMIIVVLLIAELYQLTPTGTIPYLLYKLTVKNS